MMHGRFFEPMFFGQGILPLMWIWGIVMFGIIVVGIVYLLKLIMNPSSNDSNNRKNIDYNEKLLFKLKERYVSGEISKDEFEAMKRELL